MKILRLLPVLIVVLFSVSCKEKPTELIQLDDPIFSPAAGNYLSGQAITLTCPEYGATIRYTTDGTDPTEASTLYTGPLIIPTAFPEGEASATIKARAWKTGFDPSNIVQAVYSVTYFNTVSTPFFYPSTPNITTDTEITIACSTMNTSIHYTMDGTDPTLASPQYTDSFTIAQTGEVTVKARAYRASWNPSDIAIINYTVNTK